MIPNSRFQIRNLPFFRLFTSCSRLTALLLTAHSSPLFAATPGFDTLVNYDTAWTFVYDGGKQTNGTVIYDNFYDVKSLNDNSNICIGSSGDSTGHYGILLMKISSSGKVIWKKLLNGKTISPYHGGAIAIARNGDFLIGGLRYSDPWFLRTDSIGNIKWQTWLYDTATSQPNPLSRSATINSLQESSRGTIICAAGDPYPNNGGTALSNYAAYLEFDSLGKLINYSEWKAVTGIAIAGFSIAETKGKNMLLGGNQAVFYLDSVGNAQWQTKYTFQLNGVGSVTNNIFRVKVLRDNTPMVMGQAFEGNCWTKYQKLYYDAWWSPIAYESGMNTAWDTAGYQGGDDHLYDFTQLANGNLVFVGNKAYTGGTQPIWLIVTDSTGKNQLWQTQVSGPLGRGGPMSVCATSDNGFTVVGYMDNGSTFTGYDAFVAHFIPKPVSAVVPRNISALKSINDIYLHVSGKRLIVSDGASMENIGEVSLFDITGRRIATQTGNKEIAFDISKLARGTYIVRAKSGSAEQTMLIRVIL